jgi:hypothetical protein
MRRRDEADPELAERLQWIRDVAVAAADLFTLPPLEVSLTEIAEVAGVSVRLVGERFRSPVEVAAVSTYRHLPAISAAFDRRVEIDVELGLVDALCELVRLARAEPSTGVPPTVSTWPCRSTPSSRRRWRPWGSDLENSSASTSAVWWSTRCSATR